MSARARAYACVFVSVSASGGDPCVLTQVLLREPMLTAASAHLLGRALTSITHSPPRQSLLLASRRADERTYQVLNGTLATVPSYIEINVGDGGNREGPALPWCEPISLFPWSAYRDAVFGHGSFETFNETHARWSWIRNNNTEFEAPGE